MNVNKDSKASSRLKDKDKDQVLEFKDRNHGLSTLPAFIMLQTRNHLGDRCCEDSVLQHYSLHVLHIGRHYTIIIIRNLYSAIMPLGGYRGAGGTGR